MESEHEREHLPGMIELPAPSQWPFVTAFGIALVVAGLVTSLAVSGLGFVVLLCGATGWFRDVLPVAREVLVKPLPFPAEPPIAVRPFRRVDHLRAGADGHRTYLPMEVHPYSAGLVGGIFGGVGMAIIACAYGLIFQGSIWYPVNIMASAALPYLVNAGPAELKAFHMSALIVGFISHGIISLLVGLLYAAILPMMPSRFSAFWGSFLAPVLWTALFFSTLRLINPALNAKINWAWFIASQVAFGLITGYVVAHSKMVETAQSWPLAARAGMEAPGLLHKREEDK
jgi:hypothetical protein